MRPMRPIIRLGKYLWGWITAIAAATLCVMGS